MLESSLGIGVGIGLAVNPTPILLLAYIPWGFFVVPVWGFIIVAQMLGQWGSCVSLY